VSPPPSESSPAYIDLISRKILMKNNTIKKKYNPKYLLITIKYKYRKLLCTTRFWSNSSSYRYSQGQTLIDWSNSSSWRYSQG
jgi:hypothetical protein